METIDRIVRELVQLLGATINNIESANVDGILIVSLDTDINSRLVGKDGEHLRALLALAREIAAKLGLDARFRIDIGGYESAQKDKHEVTARIYAERARHIGKIVDLPASDPFARRIMHTYIAANYPDLVTSSEGEGRERHLVITKI